MIHGGMEVSIHTGKTVPSSAQAVAVMIHKQTRPADLPAGLSEAQRQGAKALMSAGVATGKSNEVTVQLIDPKHPRRLVMVGLGNQDKFSAECLREGAAALAKTLRKQKIASVALLTPKIPASLPAVPESKADGRGAERGIEAIAAGFTVGLFEYDEYKGAASREKEAGGKPKSARLTLVNDAPAAIKAAVERGRIIASSQNFARTIASRPGNDINPPTLAAVARKMAGEVGLTCRILDEKRMKQLGMGGILAVGGGSATPPRMIVLEHRPPSKAGRSARSKGVKAKSVGMSGPLLVVGKAITFDTGGISIKPADKMGKMIFDKCGGMAVLGFMRAAALLRLPIPIVGILSSAENHIGSLAYRPGDYLKMTNGVTVEVTNTDAEGRLVLGDALAWGIQTYKPAAVVDLATLTGGVVIALGRSIAGMMSNNDNLSQAIQRASDAAGEKVWRLPLGHEQREQIESEVADIVNAAGREAHVLQGGAFLSYFVPESTPWAHLDIAGVAETEKELPLYGKGATGWGVRTLVEWASASI